MDNYISIVVVSLNWEIREQSVHLPNTLSTKKGEAVLISRLGRLIPRRAVRFAFDLHFYREGERIAGIIHCLSLTPDNRTDVLDQPQGQGPRKTLNPADKTR